MIRGNWRGRGPEAAAHRLTRRTVSRRLLNCLSLHVDEERRIPATLGHQPLTLLLGLALLLAILAADRERQGAKTPFRDFFAALEAIPERPLFQTAQGFLDLVERLRLHLDQGELDLILNICFGALGR